MTIADDIARHAAERPTALALIDAGRQISFGQFAHDLGKFTGALRRFGLQPGSTAAVTCGDRCFEWLLLLAFEQLGVATASVASYEGQECWPFLAEMDFILSDQALPALGRPHHLVTKGWLASVLTQADVGEAGPIACGPDDPVRVLRTSGTSGGAKRMVLTRRMHELKYARWASVAQVSDRSRFLLTMPFTVGSSYMCASACLRAGATVVAEGFAGAAGFAQTIARHAVTQVGLLPMHLNHVIEGLRPGAVKPPGPTVFAFGAAVSAELGKKALERLGGEVCDIYGANEVGLITYRYPMRDDVFGTIGPGVEVEIVGDQDEPLRDGETGRIRVRTDCMVHGYPEEPAATAAMFKDGWFYPGDLGIVRERSRLRVIGRSDDLLNIGGAKLAPSLIEELVLKCAAVREAGVCTIKNAAGIEELCVAVSGVTVSDGELLKGLGQAFQNLELGNYHVLKVDQIPRNAGGKIQRDLLKSTFASTRAR